jgi:uncharacterized protein
MIVEKNVSIPMRDGHHLMANIFRPDQAGRYPVLMCLGIYGKDVHFEDAYKPQWDALKILYPTIDSDGSSGKFLRWEVPDPERWVLHDYITIVVDARGSGNSPGYLDPFSSVETFDYFDAIEWAGTQDWSNGKVGLLGISYLSITQWQVAALQPPHLAAICPWEGGSDLYRDWSHHGGILNSSFPTAWMPRQVFPNQHGNANTNHRDRSTGERTTGPAVFSEKMLQSNRADHAHDLHNHQLDDEWYGQRSPNFDRIITPLYSSGNWGGVGLHLRGNIEGYLRSASNHKWLSVHVGTHFESFYLTNYIAKQRQFFDHFLKGADNGWDKEPPVQLEIRSPSGVKARNENEWPLARTQWTKYYLNIGARTLENAPPASDSEASFESLAEGLSFALGPFKKEAEFTGPISAHLHVASKTTDMDIFATIRLFDAQNKEVRFIGASEQVPVTRGWLRLSHRKLDPSLTRPYRPYLVHDEIQPMEPNHFYAVDVEIWPTSIVVPQNYSLMLTIQGKDFEFPDTPGRMLHNSDQDRPGSVFDTTYKIASGPGRESYILMPLIPD